MKTRLHSASLNQNRARNTGAFSKFRESGVMPDRVIPDNAVLANRETLVIFHYPVAIAT